MKTLLKIFLELGHQLYRDRHRKTCFGRLMSFVSQNPPASAVGSMSSEYIAEKLARMLRKNITRGNFAELFQNIIDNYNAGGSQNDDFFEKLLKFMEYLKTEEERHIKEELSEEELELFDLLRKEKLTKDEEKRVKRTAKILYETLTTKKLELFIVDWQNDPQPKEKVKREIITVLDSFLPESYERDVFTQKSNMVYEHIVDQAMMGFNWVV